MSDIFRNLKGTSKTEFRLGLSNRGSGLYSGASDPASSYTVSAGDVWFDKNNQRLAIRTGGNAWTDVTNTAVVESQIQVINSFFKSRHTAIYFIINIT